MLTMSIKTMKRTKKSLQHNESSEETEDQEDHVAPMLLTTDHNKHPNPTITVATAMNKNKNKMKTATVSNLKNETMWMEFLKGLQQGVFLSWLQALTRFPTTWRTAARYDERSKEPQSMAFHSRKRRIRLQRVRRNNWPMPKRLRRTCEQHGHSIIKESKRAQANKTNRRRRDETKNRDLRMRMNRS